MALWGIEVKPGKPFTHHFNKARGRLRISQLTLGICCLNDSFAPSQVQCKVGDRSPITLFRFSSHDYADDSCRLDLELEEEDDVVFSVIGPFSVHLTGFYLGNGGCSRDDVNEKNKVYGDNNNNHGITRDYDTVVQDAEAEKCMKSRQHKDSSVPSSGQIGDYSEIDAAKGNEAQPVTKTTGNMDQNEQPVEVDKSKPKDGQRIFTEEDGIHLVLRINIQWKMVLLLCFAIPIFIRALLFEEF